MTNIVHSLPSPFIGSDSLQTTGNNTVSTTGSYVTVTGSSRDVTFPAGTTGIFMTFSVSFRSNGTGTGVNIRPVIGPANGGNFPYFFDTANVHFSLAGSWFFSGSFSGSTTVKLEVQRYAGSGSIILDSNDNVSWGIVSSPYMGQL